MNFDTIITQVVNKTGKWADATLRTQVLADLQSVQAQLELAPVLPWFLWREQPLVVTAGSSATNLPTGFIRFDRDVSYVRVEVDGETKFLHPLSQELFEEYLDSGATSDYPLAYTLTAAQLLTAPVSASNVTVYLQAAFNDTAPVDAASANLWATHAADVLVYRTAARIAGDFLQDSEVENRMEQRAATAWDILKRHTYARMQEHEVTEKGE